MDSISFDEVMELSNELIAVHNSEGAFLRVSQSCEKLIGYDPSEIIGKNVIDFLAPEDVPVFEKGLSAVKSVRQVNNLLVRFLRKDGIYIWLDMSMMSHEREGDVLLSSSSRDVSSHVAYKEELQEQKQRFELLAKNIPGVLYLCNNDETFSMIYLNEKVEELTGYSREDFFSGDMDFVQLYHEEDKNSIFMKVDQALAKQKPFNLLYRIKHKNGSWRWVEEHGQGIYDENGLKYLEGVLLDVTELNQTKMKLEDYVNNLEALVNERTIEIKNKNEALQQSLKDLKKAQNQLVQSEKLASLGTLIAGVGHELNNPLNYIKNGSRGLQKLLQSQNISNDSIDMMVDAIDEGVNRSAAIVDSLRQFSRQSEAMNEQCDLHQILDNCLRILNNQLKDNIEVHKQYHGEACQLTGNSGRLHQAFLNFIQNAIQAMEVNGQLHLSTNQHEQEITLKIRDTGHGIDEKYLKVIADPFFTTKSPGKGTGLGLSIAYQIIEEHMGKVRVASVSGEGTEFTVVFSR